MTVIDIVILGAALVAALINATFIFYYLWICYMNYRERKAIEMLTQTADYVFAKQKAKGLFDD